MMIDTNEIIRKMQHSNTVTRSAPISISEGDRTVDAVLSTENPAVVYDYGRGEYISEVLLMDGVDLPANGKAPMLDNHDRWSGVSALRGSVRDFQVVNGELRGKVHFSSTAEDDWTKAREGDLTDLSVGYTVDRAKSTSINVGEKGIVNGKEYANDGQYPLVIRTSWKLKEVSITPIGADENAKFRSEEINQPKGGSMPDKKPEGVDPAATPDTQRAEVQPPAVKPEVDVGKITAAARKEAAEAERARIKEIDSICRDLSLPEEFSRKLIDEGASVEDAGVRAIREFGKSSPVNPSRVRPTADESDKLRSVVPNVLLQRAGAKLTEKEDEEVRKSGYADVDGVHSLARTLLRKAGVNNVERLTGTSLIDKILDHCRSQSSSDFPILLSSASNKSLQRGYAEVPRTWDKWTGRGVLTDFKAAEIAAISPMSDVQEMIENESFQYGKMKEKKETAQLSLYGLAWGISYKSLVNDDLNAFSRVPAALGASMARRQEKAVYAALFGAAGVGPTMTEDSKAMFHTDHGNLLGDLAPTVTDLDSVKAALRKIALIAPEAGHSVVYTDGQLKYILCPVALEGLFLQILNSEYNPFILSSGNTTNSMQRNSWFNGFEIVSTPYLDAHSATNWWAATDPNQVAHLSMYTLAGQNGPTIRQESGRVGERLGITMDISFAFSVAAEDWRGMVKVANV